MIEYLTDEVVCYGLTKYLELGLSIPNEFLGSGRTLFLKEVKNEVKSQAENQ